MARRNIRFPIAGLMLTVLVAALGLAALRNASDVWAGTTFLATCAVLCLAIVGVVCRGGGERAWWLGFALFGWGYLLLATWSTVNLPTMAALDAIAKRLGVPVQFEGGVGGGMGGGFQSTPLGAFGGFGGGNIALADQPLRQIAHCLWALVAALIGGSLARALFGGGTTLDEKRDPRAQVAARTDRRWWLWPMLMGLAGCLAIVVFTVLGSRTSPGFWAGAAFLTTCGLLGIAILGAIGDQGKGRQVGIGSALFGIGYLILAFGMSSDQDVWPSVPTDHLLFALRDPFLSVEIGRPSSGSGVIAANARIWQALQQPVPMMFLEDTPLEDVLKHVDTVIRGTDGKPLPIYVDPIGLQEAEKTMTSTVRNLDFEGVPLKTTLRLCLKQLDLTYAVRDGLLFITSEESAVTPVYQDPFLIDGHCLLALLAAGFGGCLAPVFSGKHGDPHNVST